MYACVYVCMCGYGSQGQMGEENNDDFGNLSRSGWENKTWLNSHFFFLTVGAFKSKHFVCLPCTQCPASYMRHSVDKNYMNEVIQIKQMEMFTLFMFPLITGGPRINLADHFNIAILYKWMWCW